MQQEPPDAPAPLVLLVEDDAALGGLVADHLERNGFRVRRAERFDRLKDEFLEADPALVLLDVNLPWFDGFYWCRQIRTVSTVPVLFLTARDGSMDQVLAIDNGADDYIVKPFSLEVVTAKVRAALRRAYGAYAPRPMQADRVTHAGVSWDARRLEVEHDGRRTELTRNEGRLLARLLGARGQVVARESLLEALWDDADFVDDNTLTVNVTRLRRKLVSIGMGDAVRTVRGEGYRLQTDAVDDASTSDAPLPRSAPGGRHGGG